MPAEAKGKRRSARVDDLQRQRQLLGRKLQRLPCTIGKRPLACMLAQCIMVELEQRALRRRSDDAPSTLPAVAVNRMWLIPHVARQRVSRSIPTQHGIGDAIGKGDQRIRRKQTNSAQRQCRSAGRP